MATISKTGISPGSVIDAQHILNIIEALDGTAATTVVATGSLQGTSSFAISSSYAVTASYALNGGGGGGSTFPYNGNAIITGSLLVSGSGITITGSLNAPNITGSLQGTASYVTGSIFTGGNIATSASYAITASYALNGGGGGISKSDLYLYLNPTVSGLGGSYTPDISAKAYREVFVRLDGVSSSFTINNPTTGSTPMEGDRIVFRINDNGTARNLSWGTSYVQRGASLPTSTNTANKLSTTTLIYNASASKWDSVGYVIEY